MTILKVNLGNYANDSTGDDLRTAFEKSNGNFDELDLTRVISADNLGSGAPVFKEKIDKNLKLRSIKSGLNISVTYTDNEINIATPDSINAVQEDPNPRLGGDLNLNGRLITGTGNILISGNIEAQEIEGEFTGNLTGNVTGNLTGNVTGNLTGVVTALAGSSLVGNVTGSVSSIGNHNLNALADVDSTSPLVGQALVWSGSSWGPGTIVAGVSRIIAGSNISISPAGGTGEVTINSLGGGSGGDLDFGSFLSPSGFTLDLGSF
jgi:hypothetical protein